MAQQGAMSAVPSTNESEAFWNASVSSIEKNDDELIIPANVALELGSFGLDYLKQRLSYHLGGNLTPVQVIGFHDGVKDCYRIMRMPAFPGTLKLVEEETPTYKIRAAAKKLMKVPRPPNAFILFRAYRHPEIKEEYPELHNNDISVIVGKEWKDASEKVKNHFRTLAEVRKAKHAAAHPNYHYAPRKASEKKRRMTAKKAARLAQTQTLPTEVAPMTIDAGHEANINMAVDPDDFTTMITDLADGSFQITLPTNVPQQLDAEMEEHYVSVMHDSRDPVGTSGHAATFNTAPAVQIDQDFFDSLIDWQLIEEDLHMLQASHGNTTVPDANGNVVITGPARETPFEEAVSDLAAVHASV